MRSVASKSGIREPRGLSIEPMRMMKVELYIGVCRQKSMRYKFQTTVIAVIRDTVDHLMLIPELPMSCIDKSWSLVANEFRCRLDMGRILVALRELPQEPWLEQLLVHNRISHIQTLFILAVPCCQNGMALSGP